MNWKTTISALQKHGLTQPQIAFACDCGLTTICDLGNGKTTDPRHALGQALLGLLEKVTTQALAPVVEVATQ